MLIKNILFLGLAAFAAANPLLEDRATSKAVARSRTGKKGKIDPCDITSALTAGVTCPRVKFTVAQIQQAVKQAKALKVKGKKGKGFHFPAKYKHDKEAKIKVKGAMGRGTKSTTGKRDLEDGEEHEEDEDEDEEGEVLPDEEEDDDDEDDEDEDLDGEQDDKHLEVEPQEVHNSEDQSLVTRALEARRGRGGRGRSRSRPKPTKPKTTKPKTTKPKPTKPKKTKCNPDKKVKVGKGVWMFPILKKGVWEPGVMPELNYVILDRKYNYVKTAEREPGSGEEFDICAENPMQTWQQSNSQSRERRDYLTAFSRPLDCLFNCQAF